MNQWKAIALVSLSFLGGIVYTTACGGAINNAQADEVIVPNYVCAKWEAKIVDMDEECSNWALTKACDVDDGWEPFAGSSTGWREIMVRHCTEWDER